MCGSGQSNDGEINIYLGWYGAYLDVNDLSYCIEGEYKQHTTKEQMIEYIQKHYTYSDFLAQLLECIDNGSEE